MTNQTHLQDQIQVLEKKPDHHFRTEIPNIVDELGLDPYEYRVYALLKRIAGDEGQCWQSRQQLYKKAGMGETKFDKCIDKLSSIFPLINKPLIEVTPRKSQEGDKDTNVIEVVNIWRENGDYFRNKGCLAKKGTLPRQTRDGTSPNEDKEEPTKEELSKEASKQALCKENLPACLPLSEDKGKKDAIEYWHQHRIPVSDATLKRLLEKYDDACLIKAMQIVKERIETGIERDKPVHNPDGLLIKICESGEPANAKLIDCNKEIVQKCLIANPWVKVKVYQNYVEITDLCTDLSFFQQPDIFIKQLKDCVKKLCNYQNKGLGNDTIC